MKKLAFLVGIFSFLLFAGAASATSCYQEFTNQASICGGVAGGSYSSDGGWAGCITLMYDGNWTTGCFGYSDSNFYPTYVIPLNLNSINTNITVACQDQVFNAGLIHTYDLSVPSVCMNATSGNLSFRLYTQWYLVNTTAISCYAYDDNWVLVADVGNSTVDCSDPVEEGITWDITPSNNTITTFVSPTPGNGTLQTNDWIFINVSVTTFASSLSGCTLMMDGMNQSMAVSGLTCYMNVSVPSDTTHSFSVYSNDSNGNMNVTEARTVRIYTSVLCYQEFANQSESCGALSGGSYSSGGEWAGCNESMYDGNWSTGCFGYTESYFYPTYVVPLDANKLNTNISVACRDQVSDPDLISSYNLTIPSVCLNASDGNLSLRWYSLHYWSNNVSTISCLAYDSTWTVIANLGENPPYTADCSDPVEEGILWDLIANITLNETYNLTWFSPMNNSLITSVNQISWGLTAEEIPIYCYLSINGTGNISMSIAGNNCTYTSTSLANGTYCGQVMASGMIGSNVSSVQCATVIFGIPFMPSGMTGLLTDSGTGLGGFLNSVTDPIVNIVLGLGMVGGILAVLYGLSSAIKRAISGSAQPVG
jgi:hypothetical protein